MIEDGDGLQQQLAHGFLNRMNVISSQESAECLRGLLDALPNLRQLSPRYFQNLAVHDISCLEMWHVTDVIQSNNLYVTW